MPFFFLLLAYWFLFPCYADEASIKELMDIKVETLYAPPLLFEQRKKSAFLPQVPKVNLATGEYCEAACDLVVAGSEPLSLCRFYNHFSAMQERIYGHWRINPETFMLFNFEPVANAQVFAGVGEKTSAFFLYEKNLDNSFAIQPSKLEGFTSCELTGKKHPLNTVISYSKGYMVLKKGILEPAEYSWWEGKIKDGSGCERVFKSDVRQWPQSGAPWPCKSRRHPVTNQLECWPLEFTPPYQAQVLEDKKSNGNVIRYEYEDCNASLPYFDHDLPTTYALKSIKAYSATGLLLGSIEITYAAHVPTHSKNASRLIDVVQFKGSDGREVLYSQPQRVLKKFESYDTTLCKVEAPGKPSLNYHYLNNRTKKGDTYSFPPYLYQVSQQEGCFFETTYDQEGKVAAQSAPVGPKGEKCPIARYVYQKDSTSIYNGENDKMVYRFSPEKRLIAVEKYQGESLYSREKYTWDIQTGNLLIRQIDDANEKTFFKATYAYDKHHNVIEEKIEGTSPILRTYSDDGLNNKLMETDRPGKMTFYKYLPGTDLLSAELVKLHGVIVKRAFYLYDIALGAVCIKKIVDDGTSENPDDLQGITYRHVTEVTPRRTLPCLGLPEEVREYAGSKLLKKTRYTYHPSSKIASEEHFDADNHSRFTLSYIYDAQERLVAETDALGNRTTYVYDSNFNCIEQHGPRSDQHKEWRYDPANRPIQELEWQSDGTVLITENMYDRNSRLVATIDPSGFETRYVYDALGRVIAIHYQDGAVERKAYDILGNVIQEWDGNEYLTQKEYNSCGRPTAIYHPDGTHERFFYNEAGGTLAAHIDRHGVETRYVYDLLDHLIRTETQIATTASTYSAYLLLSETDALGETTYLAYDSAGRKLGERKGSKEIFFTYDPLGQVFKIQEGDIVTSFFYDVKGQLLEKSIDGTFRETYTYDAAGNKTSTSTCVGTCTTHYNTLGDPTTIIDPFGQKTEINYFYSGGFKKEVCDPKGVRKITLYDARKRPIVVQTKNCAGEVIRKEEKAYDLAGNQIKAIESIYQGTQLKKTLTHEWHYGPASRLESFLEAGEKETQYHYDVLGRLAAVVKPDGRSIYREYDAVSRLAHYYGAGVDYTYIYDAKSRLTKITDNVRKTSLESIYDIYDNIIKEKLDSDIEICREFDPYGKRMTLCLPDHSKVVYSYKGPYVHKISYKGHSHVYDARNFSGRPTHITFANKKTLSIQWDPLLRWQNVQSDPFSASYRYDAVGNLERYAFSDPLGQAEEVYAYDDLNQLISENGHTYSYDSLFNRRSKDEMVHTVNTLLQTISDGKTTYNYDKNGNLISDGFCSYEYDLLDRLVAVNKAGERTVYAYDALNRRISKNDDLYIWDGQQEIGSMREGKIKELRILGEGKGAEIGAAILVELNGISFVPVQDHRGSLVTLLTMNGEPAYTHRYTAFGECVQNDFPWGFSNKRHDPETGFIYFGKRYYSPALGRWITPDPQGFQDGPNLYAYVSNNPLLYCDPYGLLAKSFAEVHSPWDFFGYMWYKSCSVLECVGYNLKPIPAAYHMEAFGRIGRGENWLRKAETLQVLPSSGRVLPHTSLAYINGIKNPLDSALEQRDEFSSAYGDVQVALLYNPTRGLCYDLIYSLIAKCGVKTGFEVMGQDYFSKKLEEDPEHEFLVFVHSQGGTRLNNLSELLGDDLCKKIAVEAYGPATIISRGPFKEVTNYVSKLDLVPCTSCWGYAKNVCGIDSNVTFLKPATINPLKEHYLMGETYRQQIEQSGKEFISRYLND